MFPDFIGIGAQKAGTTWLARNLSPHPEIHMPRKEVHYFDRKIKDRSNAVTRFLGKTKNDEQWRRQVRRIPAQLRKNPSFRELLWNYRFYMRHYDDRWYSQVFEPKKGKVSGEITPAYSVLGREEVAHVHGVMPDAKLIFFMRNPIERV
ncbi:MAG: sulfotransferase, partial [Rubrobacteraceae bacterium]|nr:sulfotransferase [Rubrobacteraceae bacterium]